MNDRDDEALETALRGALAPYRADPDGFARGVEKRIEDGRAPAPIRPLERRKRRTSDFALRAATLLPPVLLPKGFAETTTVAGGLAAKKLGLKLLPTALAFPAIVLVMLVLTFAFGLRSAKRTDRAHRDGRGEPKDAYREWWAQHWLHAAFVVAGLVVLWKFAPLEALLVFIIASIAYVVGTLGSLARAGHATRREVGGRCGYFLISLAPYAMMLAGGTAWVEALFSQALVRWIPMVGVVGAGLCFGIAVPRASARLGVAALTLAVAGLLGLALTNVLGKAAVTVRDAVEFVEESFGRTDWVQTASIVHHLRQLPGVDLDEAAVAARLHAQLDAPSEADQAGILPDAAMGFEALGMLRDEDLSRVRGGKIDRRLLTRTGRLFFVEQRCLAIRLLAARTPLTNSDRNALERRLLLSLPEPDKHSPLSQLEAIIETLERIDRPIDGNRARELALACLRATWTGRPGVARASFWSSPESIERDRHGHALKTRATFVSLPQADLAIRLASRYGMPDEVQLDALHDYLVQMARQYRRAWIGARHALAAVLRARVEALPQWAPFGEARASILGVLMRHRVFLGALALALFCVLATLRAPRRLRPRSVRSVPVDQ